MKDLFPKRESKKSYNKHDLEFSFVSHLSPAVPYSTSTLGYFDHFIILLDGFLDPIILGVELIS